MEQQMVHLVASGICSRLWNLYDGEHLFSFIAEHICANRRLHVHACRHHHKREKLYFEGAAIWYISNFACSVLVIVTFITAQIMLKLHRGKIASFC